MSAVGPQYAEVSPDGFEPACEAGRADQDGDGCAGFGEIDQSSRPRGCLCRVVTQGSLPGPPASGFGGPLACRPTGELGDQVVADPGSLTGRSVTNHDARR